MSPAALLLLSLAVSSGAAAGRPEPLPGPPGEGLWSGTIVYEEAAIECDLVLEIAPAAGGEWGGTVDVAALQLQYHPLDDVEVDDRRFVVRFERRFPAAGKSMPYTLRGTVAADGRTLEAELVEGSRPPVPVVLHRLGPAGSERPAPTPAAVAAVGQGPASFGARFDAEVGKVRLVVLLSPTCGRCIITADVLRRYLLDAVGSERLAVFTVWGPMLGDETVEAARAASVHLPDPRVEHLWAPDQELASEIGTVLGLDGHPAWKTVLLYPPGARWGDRPPAPAGFMHVGLPLPEERAFHAGRLAEEVRRLLAVDAAGAP